MTDRPTTKPRRFGELFGRVMQKHPDADARLVNDILRIVREDQMEWVWTPHGLAKDLHARLYGDEPCHEPGDAPLEGTDRIYAAMEKGAATAWDEWHERRAATAERERAGRLEAALVKYSHHLPGCAAGYLWGTEPAAACDCGLRAALTGGPSDE